MIKLVIANFEEHKALNIDINNYQERPEEHCNLITSNQNL